MSQNRNDLAPDNAENVFLAAKPHVARRNSGLIRIASNPWVENATLSALIAHTELFKKFDVNVASVLAEGVAGPFDAISAGEADVCMVSGYNRVVPRITAGAPLKIVGAGMRKAALAIFARPFEIRTLGDLEGKSVAVGPANGLLHLLVQHVLQNSGINAERITYKHIGSNQECYHAVVAGKADACCVNIAHSNNKDGLAIISGGKIWEALPKFTFQTAYASDVAIADKKEGLVHVMAAYGSLYEYLMSASAREVYFSARGTTKYPLEKASTQASWDFIQLQRPYCKNLTITAEDIGYLQRMWRFPNTAQTLPHITTIADMSAAKKAARLLNAPQKWV